MPEPGATSEHLSRIALELSRAGFEVDAIAGQPTYFGASRLPKLLQQDGVTVRRVWSTQFHRNRALGRIINSLTFALSALAVTIATPKKTLLLCVASTPPLLPWICWCASILRGLRYVIVMEDVYPDIAVELGFLKPTSLVTRLWRSFNRWSFERADGIRVLGRDMAQVLESKISHRSRSKMSLLPNWADGKAIVPIPRDNHKLIRQLKAEDLFIVQFSGNIGRFHEVETIVEAAAKLRKQPFLFLFIGDGAEVRRIKEEMKNPEVNNIRYMPYQPREKLGLTLTACDVGLVTLRTGLTGLAIPSKIYGILAAGKPVIVVGPEDCEPACVVRENGCGLVVPPGDADALVQALMRLYHEPQFRKECGERARGIFEKHYDVPVIVRQWIGFLNGIA